MNKNQKSLSNALIACSVFSFLTFGFGTKPVEASEFLKSHSLKTLNVTGEPMALFQLFVPGAHIKVAIEDEMIGLSQKDNLLSLYIDLDNLSAEVREELEKLGYTREPAKVKEVLAKVFQIKETNNSISLSLRN